MAHFMGHEARGRRRWRGLTRHAWTKRRPTAVIHPPLNRLSFCCNHSHLLRTLRGAASAVIVLLHGKYQQARICKTVKPLCTLSISDRNCSSFHKKKTKFKAFPKQQDYFMNFVRVSVSAAAPTAKSRKKKKCRESANGMQPFWPWLKLLMLVNIILIGSGGKKWDFFFFFMIAWVDISEDWTFFFSENLNSIFATSYEFLA